jgi:hypothetical protein
MAAVVNTNRNVAGQLIPTAILLGSSGDTLTYTSGAQQTLVLFNTDTVSRTVTIDGASGTTVPVPGAGGTTVSVASGVTYTMAAGTFTVVNLDTIPAYLNGVIAIVSDLAAKVSAVILTN